VIIAGVFVVLPALGKCFSKSNTTVTPPPVATAIAMVPTATAVPAIVVQEAQTVHVQVPAGSAPGSQFQITVNDQVKTITVPPGAQPGMTLAVTV